MSESDNEVDKDLYVGGQVGNDQLDTSETLTGDNTQDPLDAGYDPPDREPHQWLGDTAEEAREGESLDDKLAEEEPDVDEDDIAAADEEPRTGRLMSTTSGSLEDEDDDLAVDVGPDGQAASAEEAAMHLDEES
ncbi:DUF5709 domain-containing protein [uncultured Jatrophihabitans sp.]|uniref:DUF5709 domain-containing protein n=1 Tax=uncultured Jatrophihabitans sp. TaxID=1610747 RepID=UPI0035C95988